MSGRRLLFFSPDNSVMEVSSSNSVSSNDPMLDHQSFILSPMDGVENQTKPTSCIMTTPRRKLSMGMEETIQSPLDDYGYGNSVADSCSSLESSLNGGPLLSSSGDQANWNWNPPQPQRLPLSDVGNGSSGCTRKTLLAKRLMKKSPQDKENLSPRDFPVCPQAQRFVLPCSQRPSSLPIFSPSSSSPPSSFKTSQVPEELKFAGQKTSIRQISSPLERMCLKSPIFHVGQLNSRPSSTASVSESDGYYSEVFDAEEWEADASLSDTMTSLINDPINKPPTPMTSAFSNQNEVVRPTPVRPSRSPQGDDGTPNEPHYSDNSRKGSLKRSSPHNEITKLHRRKRPPLPFDSNSQDSPLSSKPPLLPRSQSLCTPSSDISPALFSPGSESLIGDFSKPYALPLMKGNCRDLKCISPETVCDLLNGKYSDVIDKYNIIDCRFPYEYEGGHIRGAKNIWMQEQLLETLFSGPLEHPGDQCREIFIFHCEFSSQRGPKMCRFLRETDRKRNGMDFPKLYYPELYLMNGGYKSFSASYLDKCEPQGYRCMEDELYREELRICKLRSKSWSGDSQTRRRPCPVRRHPSQY